MGCRTITIFYFLTLGYFGPGYWSDYYEVDYEEIAGWPWASRCPRCALSNGRGSNRASSCTTAPTSMSTRRSRPRRFRWAINVMHASPAQGWLDQYSFDVDGGRIGRMVSHGSSEAFLRIAVGLGSEEAIDLAERFALRHPSDRMRLAAWDALASVAPGDGAPATVSWRRAEHGGSRLVTAMAGLRRAALEQAPA